MQWFLMLFANFINVIWSYNRIFFEDLFLYSTTSYCNRNIWYFVTCRQVTDVQKQFQYKSNLLLFYWRNLNVFYYHISIMVA